MFKWVKKFVRSTIIEVDRCIKRATVGEWPKREDYVGFTWIPGFAQKRASLEEIEVKTKGKLVFAEAARAAQKKIKVVQDAARVAKPKQHRKNTDNLEDLVEMRPFKVDMGPIRKAVRELSTAPIKTKEDCERILEITGVILSKFHQIENIQMQLPSDKYSLNTQKEIEHAYEYLCDIYENVCRLEGIATNHLEGLRGIDSLIENYSQPLFNIRFAGRKFNHQEVADSVTMLREITRQETDYLDMTQCKYPPAIDLTRGVIDAMEVVNRRLEVLEGEVEEKPTVRIKSGSCRR